MTDWSIYKPSKDWTPDQPLTVINHAFAILKLMKCQNLSLEDYQAKFTPHPIIISILGAIIELGLKKGNCITEQRNVIQRPGDHQYQTWMSKTIQENDNLFKLDQVQDLTEQTTILNEEILPIIKTEYERLKQSTPETK